MKMVKSLLLGSAAGLVAVTMGQAADLPVKAKPVEYVKVCSLYGAGFYYMPGTDMCLKIGGWVRAEVGWGNNGNFTTGAFAGVTNQRTTNNLDFRARGYITADARDQTAYGTARGYLAVGLSTNDVGLNTAANQFSANRAFVQWAGFTAGIAQSFYDFYSTPATSYWGDFPSSDTGDPGWTVFGYTAQLGNGLSATVAMEERRITQIIDQNGAQPIMGFTGTGGTLTPGSFFDTLSTNATTGGAVTAATNAVTGIPGSVSGGAAFFPGAGAYGGMQMGDITGNLRVDQAWGSAQVMGALHEVNASYYSLANPAAAAVVPGVSGALPALASAPSVLGGHPADAWGWAGGAGFKVLFPMIGPGDYIQTQVNVTKGALRYIFFSPDANFGILHGGRESFGVLTDAVYGGTIAGTNATNAQLTSAWGFNAAYDHFWVPSLHTSGYGGYDRVSYGTNANAMLCSAAGFGANFGTQATAIAGCNNNWSVWFVGSRTQWDVNKNFYLGVDVLYERMNSATTPTGTVGTANFGFGSATTVANLGSWQFRFRMHRDFLP